MRMSSMYVINSVHISTYFSFFQIMHVFRSKCLSKQLSCDDKLNPKRNNVIDLGSTSAGSLLIFGGNSPVFRHFVVS